MKIEQLRALGLERKWPRLARLQNEIADLEKSSREADVEVQRLQAELGPARDRDLDREAQAVRAGKDVPKAKHEPEVKKKLEQATRDSAVMSRALQAAQTDLGQFLAQHRGELYQDVVAARAEIAATVAEAAQEALAAYSRHEDLFYALKDLQPPPDQSDYNGPPAARSQHFLAVQTTSSASRGLERGRVEEILRYLVSLSADAVESGGADAA